MAGTASTAPAIKPFKASWSVFSSTSDLQFSELPVLHLRGAECDLDDVAVVGELAGPGRARILDFLTFGGELQSIQRIVDHGAALVVGNLADVVANAGPGCILALGHGQDGQIGMVVGLADESIEHV